MVPHGDHRRVADDGAAADAQGRAVRQRMAGNGFVGAANRTVCLWGLDRYSKSHSGFVASAWKILSRFLPRKVFRRIRKVQAVQQRNGCVRLDLVVPETAVTALCKALSKRGPRSWYAREHQSFVQRHKKTRGPLHRGYRNTGDPRDHEPTVSAPAGTLALTFLSYNVGTLRNKRDALREYVASSSCSFDIIALQETQLGQSHWTMNIKGYRAVHSFIDQTVAGSRGLSLFVRHEHSFQFLAETPWFQVIRVVPYGRHDPFLAINLYLPHNAHARRRAITQLWSLPCWNSDAAASRVVVTGDFNEDGVRAVNRFNGPHFPGPNLRLLLRRNGDRVRATRYGVTAQGRSSTGAIDHGLVSPSFLPGSHTSVLRNWDLSDHVPLLSRLLFHVSTAPIESRNPPPTWRFFLSDIHPPRGTRATDPSTWSDKFTQVVTHNSFDALSVFLAESCEGVEDPGLEEASDDPRAPDIGSGVWSQATLDRAAVLWDKAVKTSFKGANCYRLVRPNRRRHPNLSHKLRRRLKRRRKLYKRVLKAEPASEEAQALVTQWQALRERTAKQLHRERHASWKAKMGHTSAQIRDNPSAAWSLIRNVAGWKPRTGVGFQPLKDLQTGELKVDATSVGAIWKQHYATLFADLSGNSKDPTKWQNKFGPCPPERRMAMEALNVPFTVEECQRALHHIKSGKAPGLDDIPSEVYKILSETVGHSPMADSFLAFLNGVYLSGRIPADWETNIIVPIFKKGDETDTQNYRGVALMCTALKVLCSMLNRRLNLVLEDLKLLKPHQAGFRQAEEAIAQAACLVELLQRRTAKEQETYVFFVDLVKAYDMVPHEALFQKMEQRYGIHGEALRFIRALYASSKCRVRIGTGASATLSEEILCLRGLRQGCILSPILFDIFIDDIFDEVEDMPLDSGAGVTVPGCDDLFRIPGLLFADDLAAVCSSPRGCELTNHALLNWMTFNEMDVNIVKCGLLHFGPGRDVFLAAAAAGQAGGGVINGEPVTNCWWYKGQLIPRPQSYCYLGVDIEHTLSYEFMFRKRYAKATSVVGRTWPFFQSQTIPMHLRLLVVKMVIYPTILYGTEITGGSQERVAPAQTLINRLLRMIIGVGLASKGKYSGGLPVHALWRELACPPIHVLALARRCRLYVKGRTLKTHLPTLIANRKGIGSSGTKWTSTTRGYLTRYGIADTDSPRDAYYKVKTAVWNNLSFSRLMKPDGGGRRLRFNLVSRYSLNPMIHRETEVLGLGGPTRQLIRMRMDAWWGCQALARAKLVNEGCKDACPFCIGVPPTPNAEPVVVPETALHAVLQCPAWRDLRAEHLDHAVADIRAHWLTQTGEAATEEVILQGLLGGQPGDVDDMQFDSLFPDVEEDLWFVPKPIRDGHVNALLSFLHALSQHRGPTIRTLIATESQSHTGRARRQVHPWALDVT